MRLRRSEDEQFIEAAEVAIAREKFAEAMARLDEVLDRLERRLTEDLDAGN